MKQEKKYSLENDMLRSELQHVIGLRVSLRSAGLIQDGDSELMRELQNIFRLNDQEVQERIEFHMAKNKEERLLVNSNI